MHEVAVKSKSADMLKIAVLAALISPTSSF